MTNRFLQIAVMVFIMFTFTSLPIYHQDAVPDPKRIIVFLGLQDLSAGNLVGQQAPDFELRDLLGASVSLKEQQNKVVVLFFWGTWCPTCWYQLDMLNELYMEQQHNKITVLSINIGYGDGFQEVKNFLQKKNKKIVYPMLLDNSGTVRSKYGVMDIPTTYIIDRRGIILHQFTGFISKKDIEKRVNGL